MQVRDKVFILKTVRYGDADLIIQALTSAGTRVSFFARSALKSKKRFGGGVLEPTHYVNVLYEDKSNSRADVTLHTLKEAALIQSFDGLRTDYERIEMALGLLQTVSDVIREGDTDAVELFNLLGNTLKAAETSKQLTHLRIHFEVKFLGNQGVLALDHPEESVLLAVPVSGHAEVPFSEPQWRQVGVRTRRALIDYIGASGDRN